MMFSRTVRSGMMPCVLRSSGQEAEALRGSRVRGELSVVGCAVDRQLAAVGAVDAEQQPRHLRAAGAEQPGEADDLALADVEVERLDRALAARARGRCSDRACDRRRAASPAAGVLVCRLLRTPPARGPSSCAIELQSRGSSAASYSPTSLPLRSTVMRSVTAYTWSRKCVTNTMPRPCSRSRRITSNSRCDLAGVEAARRLVEDQQLRVARRAPARSRPSAGSRSSTSRASRVTSMRQVQPRQRLARSAVHRAASRSRRATCRLRGRGTGSRRPTASGRGSLPGRRC